MPVQQPISHHFTPVFYLKSWASNNRVTRFYRPYRDVVASTPTPEYAGYEDHLYALSGVSPEHRQMLETSFFSPVDSRAANAYRLLIEKRVLSLTNEQRSDWARFLISQQLRSPWALAELKNLTEQTMRQNMKSDAEYLASRKPGDPDTMYEWMEKYHPEEIEDAHKRFLPGMIDHQNMGQYLVNMQWMTLDLSRATRTLLTCDRPFLHTLGWKHPDTTLICPLSPTLLFVAANTNQRLAAMRSASASYVVRETNGLITDFAVDFVIGCDASQQSFVEKHLRHRDQEPMPGVIGKGRPGCPD
jgi:hypothetical protein